MLPNSPHVKEVVLGENCVREEVQSGNVVIDMSSIAPLAGREIAATLAEKYSDAGRGGEPKLAITHI